MNNNSFRGLLSCISLNVADHISTVDMSVNKGDQKEIEQRAASEVTEFRGIAVAPDGVEALNPGFDVTPAKYITAIVTEAGISRPPFKDSLDQAVNPV